MGASSIRGLNAQLNAVLQRLVPRQGGSNARKRAANRSRLRH
jgi:hypothetical protein